MITDKAAPGSHVTSQAPVDVVVWFGAKKRSAILPDLRRKIASGRITRSEAVKVRWASYIVRLSDVTEAYHYHVIQLSTTALQQHHRRPGPHHRHVRTITTCCPQRLRRPRDPASTTSPICRRCCCLCCCPSQLTGPSRFRRRAPTANHPLSPRTTRIFASLTLCTAS